jgi:hypothetical protein
MLLCLWCALLDTLTVKAGLGWKVADGLAHELCEVLLVRPKRDEGMYAQEVGVVRRDLLVEVQLCMGASVLGGLFKNCARGIIARRLYGECHQAAGESPLRMT